MREGETGWFYVGNGQLQYKDKDGWTDQHQSIDAVTDPPLASVQSSDPVAAAGSAKTKKTRRRLSAPMAALLAGVLGFSVGSGQLNADVLRGWVSQATLHTRQVSELIFPPAAPPPTTADTAKAKTTAARAAARKAAVRKAAVRKAAHRGQHSNAPGVTWGGPHVSIVPGVLLLPADYPRGFGSARRK
jgi:hypothetical protein